MSDKTRGRNYVAAKEDADKVDNMIIHTLDEGRSFRVEAGAGSGKTYSLNRVIEWIQANKWAEYQKKKQKVACITYTNAAVDVIAERLSTDSFIVPSTIHSFAWDLIKPYQSTLVQIVKEDESFLADETDFSGVKEVQYTLGHRYNVNGILYLHHNDVLELFCKFLDNAKFRRIFTNKFPLILIDEYQDSYKPIIDRFIAFFISQNTGPQFGFFGDAWQTIYQSNHACGLIEHENLVEIKKGANFRSAPRIVDVLNRLRPELPQRSAIDEYDGEVIAITCDDYSGDRRTERGYKGELPTPELTHRLNELIKAVKSTAPAEKLKTLMITHRILAMQQGYERLLGIIGDALKEKQEPFLLFFMDTVEPVYKSLCTSNMQLLFDTIGVKRYPITKKTEKAAWKELRLALEVAREKRAIDVIETVEKSGLVPIPPKIKGWLELCHKDSDTLYNLYEITVKDFLEIDYSQFLAAIDFLCPDADFSTEHGVKGEEYDDVIFVISKGWTQYQFETYAPMINGTIPIPKGKEAAFERNRNLFYVCCSRPKKRLLLFISLQVEPTFRRFLDELIGCENVMTYSQFMGRVHSNEQH